MRLRNRHLHRTFDSGTPKLRHPDTSAMKVILINGHGHSGSTILERVLGSVPGVWPVGEGKVLWHKLANNSNCSCGQPMRDCAQWSSFAEEAFGGWEQLPVKRHFKAQGALLSLKNTFLLRLRPAAVTARPAFRPFLDRARLYHAIGTVTGSTTIVDASKDAYYGIALARVPGLEVSVVHLARDPRSMIATPRRQQRAFKFTARWLRKHLRAETAWFAHRPRPLFVRYEDFCREPASTVRAILAHAGVPAEGLPLGPVFAVGEHHVCGGEAEAKGHAGEVTIRPAGGSERLARSKHALVTLATAPLLWRYGYLRR